MAKQKTYVPKSHAKEHVFNDGGQIIKLSFLVEDLIKFANQHRNAKGYLNLTVSKRREVGQFGDTHSVVLDTWQPTQGASRRGEVTNPAPTGNDAPPPEEDDVPF